MQLKSCSSKPVEAHCENITSERVGIISLDLQLRVRYLSSNMSDSLVLISRLCIELLRWHRRIITSSDSKSHRETARSVPVRSFILFRLSYSQLIKPQASNMLEMTITESSTSVEANHNVRPALIDRDNVLHASRYADSTAPEGGYGWKVVSACCFISFWIVGTVYSWGVMQAALSKQGLSSPPTLSWIGSLNFACIAFLALVNARVIRLLGARGTAFLGILMLSLGEILSGFLTHHVGGLFVTAGVVSGVGTRYDGRLTHSIQFVY